MNEHMCVLITGLFLPSHHLDPRSWSSLLKSPTGLYVMSTHSHRTKHIPECCEKMYLLMISTFKNRILYKHSFIVRTEKVMSYHWVIGIVVGVCQSLPLHCLKLWPEQLCALGKVVFQRGVFVERIEIERTGLVREDVFPFNAVIVVLHVSLIDCYCFFVFRTNDYLFFELSCFFDFQLNI